MCGVYIPETLPDVPREVHCVEIDQSDPCFDPQRKQFTVAKCQWDCVEKLGVPKFAFTHLCPNMAECRKQLAVRWSLRTGAWREPSEFSNDEARAHYDHFKSLRYQVNRACHIKAVVSDYRLGKKVTPENISDTEKALCRKHNCADFEVTSKLFRPGYCFVWDKENVFDGSLEEHVREVHENFANSVDEAQVGRARALVCEKLARARVRALEASGAHFTLADEGQGEGGKENYFCKT
jgi:hypothetical protein